jgi:Holliday junction resolvase
VVLVECKYNDRPSSQELEKLGEIAKTTGARVLLAMKSKYGKLRIVDPWTEEEVALGSYTPQGGPLPKNSS